MAKNSIRIIAIAAASLVAVSVQAQRFAGRGEDAASSKKNEKVRISHVPQASRCLMAAPNFQFSISGGNALMPALSRRPRRWAVMEMKYYTYAKWQDELVFNWYVLLRKNGKEMRNDPDTSQFSFYTLSTRYMNIPQGDHMACSCIDPTSIERYGEPVVISVLIQNKDGQDLDLKTDDPYGIVKNMGLRWWDNPKVFDAHDASGKKTVERRSGLVDRSKTPFALINPQDYEQIQ